MPALRYGLGAYRRDIVGLPEIRVGNMYVESAPEGGAPVLVNRPGLLLRRNEGGAVVRGMFQADGVLGGRVLTVSNQARLDGVAIGAVTGADRVRFAAGEGGVLACSGGRMWWITDTSVTVVSFPDNAPVSDVGFLRGRYVALRADTGQLYWSESLDATDWPALNYATAERLADPLAALLVVGDLLWLFGTESTEVWAPTLNADLPFSPIDGRVFPRGISARDTSIVLDNAPFWVGDDGIVYRGGDTPKAVSDNGVSDRIKATDRSDLRTFSFAWAGHVFNVLRTAQGSMAYDVSTGAWADWTTLGRSDWDAQSAVMVGSDVLVGSARNGDVWQLSDEVANDAGLEMERRFTALLPVPAGSAIISSMRLATAVGRAPLGVTPVLEMRTSRDGGFSWANWRQIPLGEIGQYRTRAGLHRLGMADAPGMVFDFRCTSDAVVRVSGLTVNEPFGGRGR